LNTIWRSWNRVLIKTTFKPIGSCGRLCEYGRSNLLELLEVRTAKGWVAQMQQAEQRLREAQQCP
jgi:hypothetical protein